MVPQVKNKKTKKTPNQNNNKKPDVESKLGKVAKHTSLPAEVNKVNNDSG